MNSTNSRIDKKSFSLFLVLLCTLSPVIAGDVFTIKRYVIGSGGGISSHDNLKVSGTVGQTVSGKSEGGVFSIQSGYWHGLNNTSDLIFKNSFE